MPIYGGGSGGNSSPSIIEYNLNQGRDINLSTTPQKIIEAAEPKTQRSFWAYFDKPVLLAGSEDMVGAIRLPAKSCFEFSDNGGIASDWWAVSEAGAIANIVVKSNQKINFDGNLLQSTLKFASWGWEPSANPGFSLVLEKNEGGSQQNPIFLEIRNNNSIKGVLYSLSTVPSDIWDFENHISSNNLNLMGSGIYSYMWDWQHFPYLAILNIIGAYDGVELIEMNFNGLSIELGERISL